MAIALYWSPLVLFAHANPVFPMQFKPIKSFLRCRFFSVFVLFYALALPWASAEKVTIATEENAPYGYFDPISQRITGLGTEVVQEVFRRAGIPQQTTVYPWSRAYKLALSTPNMAIYPIIRSHEREKMFKWVGVIFERNNYLYKLKSRHDVKAQHLSDLQPYIIGVIRDGAAAEFFSKHKQAIDIAPADGNNIKKLALGRIDAFVSDDFALAHLSKVNNIDPTSIEKLLKLDELSGHLYLAFNLDTPDSTVERCKHALASMVKDGSFAQINQRWMGK